MSQSKQPPFKRGEWRWFGAGNEHIESPTEYLPLPVLP